MTATMTTNPIAIEDGPEWHYGWIDPVQRDGCLIRVRSALEIIAYASGDYVVPVRYKTEDIILHEHDTPIVKTAEWGQERHRFDLLGWISAQINQANLNPVDDTAAFHGQLRQA